MSFDFTGKTAIITGGANGIGEACARLLAAGGAATCILDREPERAAQVAVELGAQWRALDVTDPHAVREAFACCDPPDIVVACAGTVAWGPVWETRVEDWERVIRVNLSGVFHTIQAAAGRMMPRRKGSIVVMASTNSFDGEPELTAYNASKAGLLGIVRTAAGELGPYQIRVNAVCPGLIRTRLTESHFSNESLMKEYFRHIPLGRGGWPHEVAQAVAFFASDAAAFITGATLFVDGGQMATKYGSWNENQAVFRGDHWELR